MRLAGGFIPGLDPHEKLKLEVWNGVLELINGLDNYSQKKILTLIRLIQWLSYLRFAKPIRSLKSTQRIKLINVLYHFPIEKVVGGINGLRNLLFIAYYSLTSTQKSIGYDGPINSRDEKAI